MYFRSSQGYRCVINSIPAAVEGEAHPCWSGVAAVAEDVLPLVVASCFAKAAAGYGPPADETMHKH